MKTYNIKGYPKYHVTRYGEVYSNHSGEWRLLPIKKWGNNYTVHLSNMGKRSTFIVARLVAEAYIPNPENKPCVCHKNNDKSNNPVDNLYWGTHKENMEQKSRDGRSRTRPRPGELNPMSKLTNIQRKEMVDKYKTGKYSMMRLSREYGLNSTTSLFRLLHPERKRQ